MSLFLQTKKTSVIEIKLNTPFSELMQTKTTVPGEQSALVNQPDLVWNTLEKVVLRWGQVFNSMNIPVLAQ